MGKDNLPFTFYDFLGYFIPGSFFCVSFYLLFPNLKNIFSFSQISDNSVFIYTFFVVFSYIIGHLLSYLSSISVELFSIWALDYPSRYLLAIEDDGFWRKFLSKNINDKHKIQKILRILLKSIMTIFLFPIVITDIFFRKICNSHRLLGKPFDKKTQNNIKKIITEFYKKQFDEKIDLKKISQGGTDFLNTVYHYVLENCPQHVIKIQNYVALYGFLRTICFSIVCIIWGIIIRGFGGVFSIKITLFIILLICIAALLYLDFNKFFRKCSAEILYALLIQEAKGEKK